MAGKGLDVPGHGDEAPFQNIESTRAPSSARRRKGDEIPKTFANGRFTLTRKLGEGSFGMVFLGVDSRTDTQVAIKLEPIKSSSSGQLGNESRLIELLRRPQPPQGICEVFFYGKEGPYAILAMDRLGYSFEDSIQVCGGTLQPSSVALASEQGLKLLCYLHSKGIVHRDIKSENFMWGLGAKVHHLYMIDFGMSSRYYSKKHITFSKGKDMTGTARYASIHAMEGCTQSRRDDLESYAHVMVYALRGSLPWSGLDAPSYKEKLKRICQTKAEFPIDKLCEGHPDEFKVFLQYSRLLQFEEKPRYDELISKFRQFREKSEPPVLESDLQWLDKDLDKSTLEPLRFDEPLPLQPEDAQEAGVQP